MGIFSFIILLLLSFWILHKTQFNTGLSRNILWLGWTVKISFGILFILVFTYYFGDGQLFGDAANFFNDSKILAEYGKTNFIDYLKILVGIGSDNPDLLAHELSNTKIWSAGDNGDWINDNRLIIKINSLIHFFSFSNVYIHVFIFSFLSYIGLIYIYKAFKSYVKNQLLFFIFIVMLPSIAFWGSGLTKESIMILGLGIFLYHMFEMINGRKSYISVLALLLGIVLLLMNKPYAGLIIIPLSLVLVSGKISSWNFKLLWTWPALIILGGIVLSYAPGKINLVDKTSYKQRDLINVGKGGVFFITDSSFCDFDYRYIDNFERIGESRIKVLKETEGKYKLFGDYEFKPFTISPSDKGYELYLTMNPSKSYIDVTPIDYSGIQLIKNIPESIVNTTLRPLPSDPGSNLKYLNFLQNIFLIALIVFTIFKRRKIANSEKYIILYLLSTIVITLLLIGWTTPIIGAIVRYKIGAELLLIITLFILMKPLKTKLI